MGPTSTGAKLARDLLTLDEIHSIFSRRPAPPCPSWP